jgi:REP element-mobilizing transposase RayT
MESEMLNEYDVERFPARRSPRLKGFDYATANYYFVTICTSEKKCIFGTPEELSRMGQTAALCLQKMENHFEGVQLDKWVVMPNHVHAIVVLSDITVNLSTVIGQYKAATTRKIRSFSPGIKVWQTSFHDHVIRNQADYERIWTYIEGNPGRWTDDCFYQIETDP